MSQASDLQAGSAQPPPPPPPPPKDVKPALEVGTKAPSTTKLPFPNGQLAIVLFLRYCGDPFAEKNFKNLATISEKHQEIQCFAVSQSSAEDTEAWIPKVGGTWNVSVVIDSDRDLFAQWGLGISNTWYAYNPAVLWSTWKLGTKEGIWNRPNKSGDVWQTGGAFAVDRFGNIVWTHVSKSADDVPNLAEALEKLAGK